MKYIYTDINDVLLDKKTNGCGLEIKLDINVFFFVINYFIFYQQTYTTNIQDMYIHIHGFINKARSIFLFIKNYYSI